LLLEEEPTSNSLHPSSFSLQPSKWPTSPQPPVPSPQSDERIRAGLSVQELEERLIQKTLSEVNDNRTQAAKLLGISVRTLRNKLKQYQKVTVA
jgi:DNA-binding NtrC family response regulator